MTTSPIQHLNAGNAYSAGMNLGGNTATGAGDSVTSFSSVLKSAISGAIDTGKTAESQTAMALSGKGNISDVVASVEEAKLTVQGVTAIRDKFVGAYKEVMSMTV
ncbi:flagellar hook-basal body complex protein FliE [Acetobacter persici]|uniref:Flagellar hook-basal body complex protein FliE n=1 Tax=Acetobacter persici TaxID=1076596 RepID=A0A1U9LIZ0_9PROT|nr:flagellar hook-basal body complex protein FliE [Acetobacter persici]AQT06358.1 hypothetical protein A0U91_15190 [Acetobacter persici]